MNKDKKIIIAVIITFFLVVAFIGVMFKMISENNSCVDSPFSYSAERLEDSGGNYICTCHSLDPELLDFTFNKEGIRIINPNDFTELDLIEG